jgi:hypothetical protein
MVKCFQKFPQGGGLKRIRKFTCQGTCSWYTPRDYLEICLLLGQRRQQTTGSRQQAAGSLAAYALVCQAEEESSISMSSFVIKVCHMCGFIRMTVVFWGMLEQGAGWGLWKWGSWFSAWDWWRQKFKSFHKGALSQVRGFLFILPHMY